jgi:hypothetical protein
LVFIIDDESVFDAPLEKIWRFMSTPGDHHKHAGVKNRRIEPEGNIMVMSFEMELPNGSTSHIKIRSTTLPPVGRMLEYLEGPLAGSKILSYYVPMGKRTGVHVVGEYVSNTIPEEQLRSFVMNNLEQTFLEDSENLKNFK